MNPNLVDNKLFDYDLKQLARLQFYNNTFLLNSIMFTILLFILFCIFYIFNRNIPKNKREKNVKDKLKYILDKSNSMIEYNYYSKFKY